MPKRLIFIIMTFMTPIALADVPMGTTEFVRGKVYATAPGTPPRPLKRESPIHAGEKLESGPASFAVFELQDGTRFTLRPSSRARVPQGTSDGGASEPVLALEKGSLRGKFPATAASEMRSLQTPAGNADFSDGEFTLRWCETGCGMENTRELAGKVLVLHGRVTAIDANEQSRRLKPGGKLQVADQINTGPEAFAMLMFRDGSKVALQPESQLRIKAFEFDPANPRQNRVHLQLTSGGGRFKTGTIGKIHPAGFKVYAPVVMTGVRGTGFDLTCVGPNCASEVMPGPSAIRGGMAAGLYSTVWEGDIAQSNEAGSIDLDKGMASYVANANSKPVVIGELPNDLKSRVPNPGEFSVDEDYLFQMNANSTPPAGLYVQVHAGAVTLTTADGQENQISEGSTAYMDPQGSSVVEGGSAPGFMGGESNCQ